MWSDNETAIDLLGFKVHADLIRSVVTNSNLLPLTIGVFGDWGSGKTSIMKMLQADLDPDNYEKPEEKDKYNKIAVLFFNGWLFEGYDDAKSAIISSILLQLGEHQRFGHKVRQKTVSLLKSVNWMRLAKLGFKELAFPALAACLTEGASIAPEILNNIMRLPGIESIVSTGNDSEENTKEITSSDHINCKRLLKEDKSSADPLDVRNFRERFSEMLRTSDIETLVVLVDDLDRCSPERIIENLEAIKLFLNVDNTVFVIGADPRIVRHAIAITYASDQMKGQEKNEDSDSLVTDYLEKLIQVPYRLPRLSPSEVETYMTLLFCQKYLKPELFRKCVSKCNETREENRYSVFGYADVENVIGKDKLSNKLSASLIFSSTAAPLITEGLKGNPRQIKRFLNAYILRKELAFVAKLTNIKDEVLVKLMILEYVHPENFLDLFYWQEKQDGFPKELSEWEKIVGEVEGELEKIDSNKIETTSWRKKSVLRWLAMEPNLSNIDLRDYFWIARDRLESTMSQSTMVSPILRTCLTSLLSNQTAHRKLALNQIKNLNEHDLNSLLGLVEKHISRHPDEYTGYRALVEMFNENIPGSIDTYLKVLSNAPIESIPPNVGFDIVLLLKKNPNFESSFNNVIERLMSKESKIKTVLEKASKKK